MTLKQIAIANHGGLHSNAYLWYLAYRQLGRTAASEELHVEAQPPKMIFPVHNRGFKIEPIEYDTPGTTAMATTAKTSGMNQRKRRKLARQTPNSKYNKR